METFLFAATSFEIESSIARSDLVIPETQTGRAAALLGLGHVTSHDFVNGQVENREKNTQYLREHRCFCGRTHVVPQKNNFQSEKKTLIQPKKGIPPSPQYSHYPLTKTVVNFPYKLDGGKNNKNVSTDDGELPSRKREKRSNGKTTTYEYAYRLVIKMYYSTVYIGSSFTREKTSIVFGYFSRRMLRVFLCLGPFSLIDIARP